MPSRPNRRLPALATLALLLPLAALPGTALAHEGALDDLRIAHPFALPTPPGAPNGAAYLDITVNGERPARLIGVESPASDRVEIHTLRLDGETMTMRPVEALEIAPGETLTMRPGGGPHLMLLELKAPLVAGESVPLTLEFAERGRMAVEAWVQDAMTGSEAADGHHH
ncbi:copper chaperone PCu(A)C [Onishia taeanensis]